ncbi:calcium-binding protein, partial [Thauera sinica]
DRLLVAATSSNNVLAGGAGNDTITGSYYADTYVFNLGDGVDTITDYTPYTGYTDVLQFGEGIAASDIRTLRSGLDLVFAHRNGTDRVVVKNWFDYTDSSASAVTDYLIETVRFA